MTDGRLLVRPDQFSLGTPDHARKGELIGNSCSHLTSCRDIQQSVCQRGSLAVFKKNLSGSAFKNSELSRCRRETRRQSSMTRTISTESFLIPCRIQLDSAALAASLCLARMIHEDFYCNRRDAATTGLRRAGSPLGRSTDCVTYASLPHGSARQSRVAFRRSRHEPSGKIRVVGMNGEESPPTRRPKPMGGVLKL
jgi:hypothetical protein